jgi:hypothetical protein
MSGPGDALQCGRRATVRLVTAVRTRRLTKTKGENMWWAIGFGGIVYLILVFTLGLMTLRNGHGWLFFFGIFLPILWIFGAFMRPTEAAVPGA